MNSACLRHSAFAVALAGLTFIAGCATPIANAPAEASAVEEALAPKDFDAAMAQGDDAYRARDPDRAQFAYLQAMKLDPQSALPYLRMAAIYDSRKANFQLEQALREALQREPTNAAAHERLGFTMLKLDDSAAAVAEFTQATRLDETRWRAVMGLGLAAIAIGDLRAARTHVDAAIRMQPRSAELLSYSADLHLRSGSLEPGLRDARAALAITPNQITQLILGDLLARQGDYPGGLEAYLASVSEPQAYQRLAEQAMIAKDFRRALRYFQQSADGSAAYSEQIQKRMAVARERLMESDDAEGSPRPTAPGTQFR